MQGKSTQYDGKRSGAWVCYPVFKQTLKHNKTGVASDIPLMYCKKNQYSITEKDAGVGMLPVFRNALELRHRFEKILQGRFK